MLHTGVEAHMALCAAISALVARLRLKTRDTTIRKRSNAGDASFTYALFMIIATTKVKQCPQRNLASNITTHWAITY